MKTFSLTFITILLSTFAFAQNETITGIITDDNNQPIERACVLVLDADDHSYITGTVTDENGNYEINLMQEGTFLLTADHISFDGPKGIGILNNESNLNDFDFILHKQLDKITTLEMASIEGLYTKYDISMK